MGRRCALFASATWLLLLFTAAPVSPEAPTCRVQDCPNHRVIRHYEELGCVRSDGSSSCCPTRFNCSSVLSIDKTKCHYEGKTYEPGTYLSEGIKSVCVPACACQNDMEGLWKGEARFICAVADCAAYPIPEGKKDLCYETYNLDQCCGTGVKCANDTKSPRNVTECIYKGKTYLGGQLIEEAISECKRCVCQQGYDGTLEGPWCRRHSCDYTLGYTVSQLRECAPVFDEVGKCCPHDFLCPSAEDTVVSHSERATLDEGTQCSFGDHRLKIGDELMAGGNRCIVCRCDIPPFITCSQLADSECK